MRPRGSGGIGTGMLEDERRAPALRLFHSIFHHSIIPFSLPFPSPLAKPSAPPTVGDAPVLAVRLSDPDPLVLLAEHRPAQRTPECKLAGAASGPGHLGRGRARLDHHPRAGPRLHDAPLRRAGAHCPLRTGRAGDPGSRLPARTGHRREPGRPAGADRGRSRREVPPAAQHAATRGGSRFSSAISSS